MAFNFFGKKKADAPAPPDEETSDDAEVPDESEAGGDEGGVPEGVIDEDALDLDWRTRAAMWIPGGTSTGSKRPAALYGEGTTEGPGHFLRATGCHVTTASDRTLIDCTMALGSVSLGYADDGVVRAVVASIANGHVSGLANVIEIDIAERLCEVIPCAEQVRFLKTGAEAVSAAVRIARTATGRTHVVACGYFGWHDWSNTGPGIPSAGLGVTRVAFNDIAALNTAVAAAGTDLAAIVIEPVVEALPDEAWLGRARALCDAEGAVLVFDEMKTGFRIALGGYQQVSEVKPDLAVFGKAMACGFPLAAVVGQRDVMAAAEGTWISSTAAGEAASLAAVAAVLDRYAEEDVCATLARVGQQMRQGVQQAIAASGIAGVSVHGPDPMWFLRFEDAALETHFLQRTAALGVLFKRGAYNYPALAHDDDAVLVQVERVASTALVEAMEAQE